ncbi:MAG: hypothetical protein VB131_09055 [Burkholderia gladioli]
MLDQMKRLVHRLGMLRRHKTITPAATSAQSFGAEFDTTWHGDHWQNLLASPLDARHYVMEDWAQPQSCQLKVSYITGFAAKALWGLGFRGLSRMRSGTKWMMFAAR